MKSESSDLFCNLSNFNAATVLAKIKTVLSVESVQTVGGEGQKTDICQTALLLILKDKSLANRDLFSFWVPGHPGFHLGIIKFSCSSEAFGRNCRCWMELFLCFAWQRIKKIIDHRLYYTSSCVLFHVDVFMTSFVVMLSFEQAFQFTLTVSEGH